MGNVEQQSIEGVCLELRQVFKDERGEVRRMMRCDDAFFSQFGEVYFSYVNPGVTKGWKKHLEMTQHFVVPLGAVKLVLFDDRKESKSCNKIQEIELSEDNYQLLRIPPNIWYAFRALGNSRAIITNCTDIVHRPDESVTKELTDSSIPYSW